MIAAPAFLVFAMMGASFLAFLIPYARSMLKNGIMPPKGPWLSPDTPGFRRKIIIGASFMGFVGVLFIALGLIGAFAPQVVARAAASITAH